MVYRRKTYGKARPKGRGGYQSRGRRRAGGSGRGGRSVPYRKKGSYAKGIRGKAHGKKMVRSKKSSSSSLRKSVIRALATTNTYVYEESTRVSWLTNTKYSGLVANTGLPDWGAEYYPPDMLNDVAAFVRQQIPTPTGNGLAGFFSGNPIDVYVTRSEVRMTVSSCYQVPIYGRWWCFESRYDGQNGDPPNLYNNEIGSYQGTVGGLTSILPMRISQLGTTPFNFRAVCQGYKIRPMSKVFKLEPAQPRTFKHVSKKRVHVTPRMINLIAVKHTKFFCFEFWGVPLNDATVVTNVASSPGVVDIISGATYDYEYIPIPNSYKSFGNDLPNITGPSVMVDTTKLPTLTPASS